MASDSWLTKLRSAFAAGKNSVMFRRRENVAILAFEIASLMSKLLHLWRSLSDDSLTRLRTDGITLPGVRKLVSDDDGFLLSLACAEFTDALRAAAASTSILARRCSDPVLRQFDSLFKDFAESGRDPHRWVMAGKEMEAKAKKMDRYVASTSALYKETEELAEAERALKKLCFYGGKVLTAEEAHRRIFWQQQEVKYLKQISLWCFTFDGTVSILAKSSFTILARIKEVFGIRTAEYSPQAPSWNISSFVPSAVHPETSEWKEKWVSITSKGLLETSAEALMPPETTLGAAGLAPHYAKLLMLIMEKVMQAPRGDAREELYGMLPESVRALLRGRLMGVGRGPAQDAGLVEEWRRSMNRMMSWIGPVAHGTLRWQEERNFERRSAVGAPRVNVLLLQTLYFANREKVEAAIAELLVGLNCVWRFELELCAGLQRSPDS